MRSPMPAFMQHSVQENARLPLELMHVLVPVWRCLARPTSFSTPHLPLPCWQHFARVKFASAHQAARVLVELPHPQVTFAVIFDSPLMEGFLGDLRSSVWHAAQ